MNKIWPRKSLIQALLAAGPCLLVLCGLLSPGRSEASGLEGQCADCHTMHNSQAGAPIARIGVGATTVTSTPIQNLLRYDCIACHVQDPAGSMIAELPGNKSRVPQVYHGGTEAVLGGDGASDGLYTDNLAAGNFRFITLGGNRKGHNVVDLVPADLDFTGPPGFRSHADDQPSFQFNVAKLTCAGSMGCHGWRGQVLDSNGCDEWDTDCQPNFYRTGLSALSGTDGSKFYPGAHHASYDGLKMGGSSPGFQINPLAGSYRFIHGLRGYGNPEPGKRWRNLDSQDHNEYFGRAGVAANFFETNTCGHCHHGLTTTKSSRVSTPNRTMTGFCITCHGQFHSSGTTNGESGAFRRHPSDYIIPDRSEYAGYTEYSVSAPVARPNMEDIGNPALVRPGTDMVMCLSCHMAHASPYDGMLRFDYQEMVAGANPDRVGCLACHTTKGILPGDRE